jgi:hypothetical protein
MDPGSRARRAQVRDDATVASVPQPPAPVSSAGDRYSLASSGAERGEKGVTNPAHAGPRNQVNIKMDPGLRQDDGNSRWVLACARMTAAPR